MKASIPLLAALGVALAGCDKQEPPRAEVVAEDEPTAEARIDELEQELEQLRSELDAGPDAVAGDTDGDDPTAGDRVDRAIEATGHGLQVAGEKTAQGVTTAAEKTGEALHTAGEKTEEGVKKAAEATGKFLQRVGEKIEDKASGADDEAPAGE